MPRTHAQPAARIAVQHRPCPRRALTRAALLSAAILAPASIHAAAPEAPGGPTSPVAEISQTPRVGVWSAWLTNGIRIHAKALPQAADQTFAIVLTISGGELLEPAGKRGLASAASGGWSLPKSPDAAQAETIRRYLESQVRFTAYTHTDALQLWVTGPESDLQIGMDLARLLVESPGLDDAAFQARVQMLRDLATGSDADRAAMDALRPLTLPSDMSAARPIQPSDVAVPQPDDARAWLAAALMQGSIEIGIASRIPAPESLEVAALAFADMPGRARIGLATLADLRTGVCPAVPDAALMVSGAPGASDGRALLALIGPERADLGARRALALGAFVLDDRLEAAVPGDREVRVFPMNPGTRSSRSVVGAMITSAGSRADAESDLALLSRHFNDLATLGPLPMEMEDAKEHVADILARQDLTPESWASKLATLTYDGLTPAGLARALDEYRTMTAEDVRRAYAAWCTPATTARILVVPPTEAPAD